MPVRTVRQGRIRLDHKWWKPEEHHRQYDGRLDGQRFLFLRYPIPSDLVALWGTEAAYQDIEADQNGPEMVDGAYPWYFWHQE